MSIKNGSILINNFYPSFEKIILELFFFYINRYYNLNFNDYSYTLYASSKSL